MEFERKTTVWVSPEQAFEFFANPANLPLYVPSVAFEEAIAVDGDPGAEPDAEAGPAGELATFLPDRRASRVEWRIPGEDYGGTIEIAPGTASSTDLTIRVHTRDDVDPEHVRQLLEQVARTVGRQLSGR